MVKISALPAETTPTSDDFIPIVDNAGAVTKKVTAEDLVTAFPTGSITNDKLAVGAVVQVASTMVSTVTTGTTAIPFDDTIPQITEGFEVMTLAITPKSATNKLVVSVNFFGSVAPGDEITVALFRDSTANALAADSIFSATSTGRVVIPLTCPVTASSTTATTFRVRVGPGTGGNIVTMNGFSGDRKFGGVAASSIVITEYKA